MTSPSALAYDPGKTSFKYVCLSCPTEVVAVSHFDLHSPDSTRQFAKRLCYACMTKLFANEKVKPQ